MIHEKGYFKALRFILKQRIEELNRAIARYPNSDRYQLRVDERNKHQKDLDAISNEDS